MTQKKKELTHFSLFTGIGGFDLAAEWAGFQTIGQVENADYPNKILEKHWPNVPRWRDIKNVTKESVRGAGIKHIPTLLTGGFPCQPFSVAGNQRGTEDDRHLWPEMFRVVQELRPTWIVGENVAGFIGMALDQVLSDLESAGYECRAFVFPACGVGAPHKRDRVFIVAYSSIFPDGETNSGVGTIRTEWDTWNNVSGSCVRCGKKESNEDVANANNPPTSRQREYSREVLPHTEPKRFDMGCEFLANSESIGCGPGRLPIRTKKEESVSGNYGTSLSDTNSERCKKLHVAARAGGEPISHPHQIRCDLRESEREGIYRDKTCNEIDTGGKHVSIPNSKRCQKLHSSTESGKEGYHPRFSYPTGLQWATEPSFCGMVDGFSDWMDTNRLIINTHKSILTYGNADKKDTCEILRSLWNQARAKKNEWEAGRLWSIHEEEILFAYLCKLKETSKTLDYISLTCSKREEELLRSLWDFNIVTCTPHKQRHNGQLRKQYTDSLCPLSQLLAQDSLQAWNIWRGKNATNLPIIFGRTADGISSRVDRLRCLGNAVVPQQAYPILKAIAQSMEEIP